MPVIKSIFSELNGAELAALIAVTTAGFDTMGKITRSAYNDDDIHGLWCDLAFVRAAACEAARKI